MRCLAESNRSPDDLGYALSVVCDPTKLDCGPINAGGAFEWPNTIYTHCNWAFDQYWRKSGKGDAAFCTGANYTGTGVPPGQGRVFNCSDACTKCQLKAGTTDQAAYDVIGYLCNTKPQILGPLCAPINKGGKMENATAVERASYVADLYYQPVKCDLPASACDFSGHGEVVSCSPPPASPSPTPPAASTCKQCTDGAVCCDPSTQQLCPGQKACCDCGTKACICPQ
eukprot:gene8917-23662_t